MRTIYVRRDTEDPDENMEQVRAEVDLFIDGRRSTGASGGLQKVADVLI